MNRETVEIERRHANDLQERLTVADSRLLQERATQENEDPNDLSCTQIKIPPLLWHLQEGRSILRLLRHGCVEESPYETTQNARRFCGDFAVSGTQMKQLRTVTP